MKKPFIFQPDCQSPAADHSIALVVMCILSAVVVTMSRNDSTRAIQTEVNYLADLNASEVDAYLEKTNDFSHSLAKEVQHYHNLDRTTAEPLLVETVKSVLDNDKLFGAYFAFDPNKFFPDTPDGLSYCAYRNGNTVSVDIPHDYQDYSGGDYYTGAKNSQQTYVTEPYPYELTNGNTVYLVTLSTPVVDGSGVFLGVANCDILAESINGIDFYDGGYETAYSTILTSQGTFVADSLDSDRLGTTLSGTDPVNQQVISAIQSGQPLQISGGNVHFGNEDAIISYIPIQLEGTNLQWGSGLVVSESEVFAAQRQLLTVILVVCLLSLLVLSAAVVFILRRALSPIPYIITLAEKMKRCNLTETETNVKLSDDELGQLASIFADTSDDLRIIINDINYCLNNMSNGNFSFTTNCEERYIGEYRHIIDDMRQIRLTLNSTLTAIGETADQVQMGSQKVADGSQALAQGATEQASAVEELVATIAELSGRIKNNADEAAKNTTALIGDALAAVNNGANLATSTASALQEVVDKAQLVNQKIKNIASVSGEQSDSVAQISQGIDQISSVVQTNSATAEESAAASEELSGQATALKAMMQQFTLLGRASMDASAPSAPEEPLPQESSDEKY